MAIRGDLLSADLSNVFQMLAMNGKRGRLVVQEQGNLLAKRTLYIDENQVSLLDAPPDRPVVALLVDMGVIDYDSYRSSMDQSSRYAVSPLELLQQRSNLSAEDVEAVRRRVLEEQILEIFLWRNVFFRLDEVQEDAPAIEDSFSVDELIMEAARRQDEWQNVVDANGWVHVIHRALISRDEAADREMDPVHRIVHDHVDGIRGSREIVEATGLSRYLVDLALHALHEQGFVERQGMAQLIQNGDLMVSDGNLAAGIRLFLSALGFDRRNITIHKRLAAAYLEKGQISKGAAHYRFCALTLLESGHREEALTIFQYVAELLPTDFNTLGRCVELLVSEAREPTEGDRETVARAMKLLAFYQETGDLKAARTLAERLHLIQPEDEDLLARVARLRMQLGLREEAVGAYLDLAQKREGRDDLHGALEIYRTLGGFDGKGRQTYQLRIDSLNRTIEKRQRRKRHFKGVILGALVLGVLAAGGAYYAWLAQTALDDLHHTEAPTQAGLRQLAGRYRNLGRSYPFTPAAREAGLRADEVEAKADRLARMEAETRAAAEDKVRSAIQDAERALELADGLIQSGRLADARASYADALAAGEPAGDRWRNRERARQVLGEVDTYLRNGRSLLEKGKKELAAGRRAAAFKALAEVWTNYRMLPEAEGLQLPLVIETVPAGAEVEINDAGGVGKSPVEVMVPADGALKVKVRAPGHQAHVAGLTEPATSYVWRIVLERDPDDLIAVGEPVFALARWSDDRVVALARNGRLMGIDLGQRVVRWRNQPESIHTTRQPPLICSRGAVVVCIDGHLRLVDPSSGTELWKRELPRSDGVVMGAHLWQESLIVAGMEGIVRRLDLATGNDVWVKDLKAQVASVAAISAGSAVALADGKMVLIGGSDGEVSPPRQNDHGRELLGFRDGRLIACVEGQGVVVVDPEDGKEKTIIAARKPLEAPPICVAERVMAVLAGGRLVMAGPGDAVSHILLAGRCRRLVALDDRLVAAELEGGPIQVIDVIANQVVVAWRPQGREPASPTVCGGWVVGGHASGQLELVRLP